MLQMSQLMWFLLFIKFMAALVLFNMMNYYSFDAVSYFPNMHE